MGKQKYWVVSVVQYGLEFPVVDNQKIGFNMTLTGTKKIMTDLL
jgi:hypothetical protein